MNSEGIRVNKIAVLSNLSGTKNKLVKVKLIIKEWYVVLKAQSKTQQPSLFLPANKFGHTNSLNLPTAYFTSKHLNKSNNSFSGLH